VVSHLCRLLAGHTRPPSSRAHGRVPILVVTTILNGLKRHENSTEFFKLSKIIITRQEADHEKLKMPQKQSWLHRA